MRFEWDENKRKINLQRHGLDFADAEIVFEGETYTDIDDRFDYGEERLYTIGMLNGIAVVIAHTEESDAIRIISFRKAEKYEEELYFKKIRD